MGILLVVPGVQTTEFHSLSQGRLPDVVIVDQRHGGLGCWWCGVCVEDEEMVDGNDEVGPCLICLGPRPYQATCHQDRTGPYLSLSVILLATLAQASQHRYAIIIPLVLITSPFFHHFPPYDHYASLISTPP